MRRYTTKFCHLPLVKVETMKHYHTGLNYVELPKVNYLEFDHLVFLNVNECLGRLPAFRPGMTCQLDGMREIYKI